MCSHCSLSDALVAVDRGIVVVRKRGAHVLPHAGDARGQVGLRRLDVGLERSGGLLDGRLASSVSVPPEGEKTQELMRSHER